MRVDRILLKAAHSVPHLSIQFLTSIIRGSSVSKSIVLEDLVSLIHKHIMKTRNEEKQASQIKEARIQDSDDSGLLDDETLVDMLNSSRESCQKLPGTFEENMGNKYVQENTDPQWLDAYVQDRNNKFKELLIVNLDFERKKDCEQDVISSLFGLLGLGVKKIRHLYWEKQEKPLTDSTEETEKLLSEDIDPFLSVDTIEIQVGALELPEKEKLFAFLKEELDTNKTIPASEHSVDENLRLLLIECINLSFLFFKISVPVLKFLYGKFMNDSIVLINKTNTNRFLAWFIASLQSLQSKFDPPSGDLETLLQDSGQFRNSSSFWPSFRIQRAKQPGDFRIQQAQQSEDKSHLSPDSDSYEKFSLFNAAIKFANQF